MFFAVISVVFLPMVLGAVDPTKVCAPDQVSFYGYDIVKDVISFVVIDYKQSIMGVATGNTTIVNDLSASQKETPEEKQKTFKEDARICSHARLLGRSVKHFYRAKSYVTDDQGHCTSSDLASRNLYPQCLPAEAVRVGDLSVGIGDDQIMASGWQFPYAGGNVKVAFTDQTNEPNFPILSRFSDDKGVIGASFYFDVVANITKPDLLVIPSPCPPKVIV